MTLRNRLRAPLTSALVAMLVGGLLVLAPEGARADDGSKPTKASVVGSKDGLTDSPVHFPRSSYLCYGYRACAKAGMGASGYPSANSKMYWRMYSGHNCTNYAAYRMVRSGLPNVRPWSGGGNATYWGTSVPKKTDRTPMVGAVAWWKANVGPAGSVGHVAYVERVVSATEVIVSQDSWGGDFSWARITKASGNWPSGFIHFNDVSLLNKVEPAISGLAKVGGVLSASQGTWSPSDATLRYQWYAAGAAIAGATGATYVPTAAQLGQQITVAVTGSKLGYPTRTVTSGATAAVLPGVITNVAPPALGGVAKVGHTMSVTLGTWTPAVATAVQWYADGAPIPGATSQTLAITPDLATREVSAVVTARRNGYTRVPASSATRVVALGTLHPRGPAGLRGTARPGQVLTATAPATNPASIATYQWLRSGQPIAGATGATYQVGYADLGSVVSARVTLSRPGYAPVVRDTPATSRVRSTPRVQLERDRSAAGHRLRLWARVVAPGVAEPTGTVVVQVRGVSRQVLDLSHGKARIQLRGIPRGRYTVTLIYRGDAQTLPLTKSTVIRLP